MRSFAEVRPWIGAAVFAALFVVVAAPRLTQPPDYVFDEVYQAFTASRYVAGDASAFVWDTKPDAACKTCAYEWVHPPLAKYALAASIALFGDNALGWRAACVLAGALLVALAYALGRKMYPGRWAATLAALGLALDGMVLVLSRTGMADVFVAPCVLGAYGAFFMWWQARDRGDARAERRWLYAAGALLGVGIATKWFALLAWGFIGMACGGAALLAAGRGVRLGSRRRAFVPLGHVLVALVVVPAAIYIGAYAPFFALGHGVHDFVELLRQQVHYHAHLGAMHDYAAPFWSWPMQLRSVWLWTGTSGDVHRDIYLFGNPALWWPGCLALALVLANVVADVMAPVRPNAPPVRIAPADGVVLMGFFGQWLPWAVPARITFVYYLLCGAPFVALAVGGRLGALLVARPRLGAALAGLYVAALLAAFAWFYPVWTGWPLAPAAWNARFLLPGWR